MPADPVEAITAAWIAWDHTPTWPALVERRLAAVTAAGLTRLQEATRP